MIDAHDSLLDEPCWLLPHAPDWNAGVETRLSLPAEVERGLTGRESRHAYAATARVEMRWESLLGPAEAAALRNALQDPAFDERPIWWPWWPAATDNRAAAGDIFDAAQQIRVDHPLSAQLEPPGSPAQPGGYPPAVRWAAALRGYFVERPTLTALTDELFVARWHLREDGPAAFALQAAGATPPDGPAIGGRAHTLFPWRPQWTRPVETGRAEVEREARELGFGREAARALYAQGPERLLRLGLALGSAQDGADLIDFWQARAVAADPFWAPTWLAETRLTDDLPIGAATLPVSGGDRLGGNAYVALLGPTTATEVLPVLTAGPTALILGAGVAQAHPMGSTALATAALVRFARPTLTLRWHAPDDLEAEIELREVATAYYTPPGETHGTTLGALERPCFLYTFTVGWVPPVQVVDFADSLAGWGAFQSALSTESGWARVTYSGGGSADFLANRTVLTVGKTYRLVCELRGDGVTAPMIRLWGGATLYTGSAAATAQAVSLDFVATATRLDLFASTTGRSVGDYFEVRSFAIHEPAGGEVWRETSYEAPLDLGDGPHAPAPIEHGEIRETLGLEQSQVTLRTRARPGHPLLRFFPFGLEAPLRLEIVEARLAAGATVPSAPQRIFAGEVTRVRADGPFLTATAELATGRLFERKLPRMLLQPTCNYALFDGGCGLAKAAWAFEGAVIELLAAPPRLRLHSLARPGGTWVAPGAHFFAGGWVELGSGVDAETRSITDSAAWDPTGNGWIELTLATAPVRVPLADEVVVLYPGCDGQRTTCQTRFANFDRFGGFPHLPVGNPSMIKMPANRNMK